VDAKHFHGDASAILNIKETITVRKVEKGMNWRRTSTLDAGEGSRKNNNPHPRNPKSTVVG
jgi:hypothetical protein